MDTCILTNRVVQEFGFDNSGKWRLLQGGKEQGADWMESVEKSNGNIVRQELTAPVRNWCNINYICAIYRQTTRIVYRALKRRLQCTIEQHMDE